MILTRLYTKKRKKEQTFATEESGRSSCYHRLMDCVSRGGGGVKSSAFIQLKHNTTCYNWLFVSFFVSSSPYLSHVRKKKTRALVPFRIFERWNVIKVKTRETRVEGKKRKRNGCRDIVSIQQTKETDACGFATTSVVQSGRQEVEDRVDQLME